MALENYIGKQSLGILAAYQNQQIAHYIGIVYPRTNNELRVFIPKGHQLNTGDLVTLHLDNRTGVDNIDANLKVYRTSYKGRVYEVDDLWVMIEPVEYMLIYGIRVVEEYREPGYEFPDDPRLNQPIPISPISSIGTVEHRDHENKIGVLTTLAQNQPHTTVLAFLSTTDDDIYVICTPDSFKKQLLLRDSRCFFTIDERANYTFEQAVEWNYTVIEADTYLVPPSTEVYEQIRNAFILKNPWEVGFFSIEGLDMYHLKCKRVVPAGEWCPL